MEGFAERKGCMWAVQRTFLDDAHKSRSPRFELVDGGGLSALVEGCDAKNGMDVGFSAKRIADGRIWARLPLPGARRRNREGAD